MPPAVSAFGEIVAWVEQAVHLGLRARRRMERNMGVEYAEKMRRVGESGVGKGGEDGEEDGAGEW